MIDKNILKTIVVDDKVKWFYIQHGNMIDMRPNNDPDDEKIESWMFMPFWIKKDRNGVCSLHYYSDIPGYAKEYIDNSGPEWFDLPKFNEHPLTPENIIAEGWKEDLKNYDRGSFDRKTDSYKARIDYDYETRQMIIYYTDASRQDLDVRFEGTINSINEFRFILKLLNLNTNGSNQIKTSA